LLSLLTAASYGGHVRETTFIARKAENVDILRGCYTLYVFERRGDGLVKQPLSPTSGAGGFILSKNQKPKLRILVNNGELVLWHPDDGSLLGAIEQQLNGVVACMDCANIRNAEQRMRRVHARNGSIEEMYRALIKPPINPSDRKGICGTAA
jgi:hypothetical protein